MVRNASPQPWTRLGLLALAMMMPLLAGAALVFFAGATVMVGSSDRALVWAEGDPSQLDAMSRRVADSPWFPHGRARAPDAGNPKPLDCGDTAYEFSFGSLRAEQGQAARSVLESYALDSGARICQTNTFVINEHPDPAATPDVRLASAVLQSSLIPCGIALLVYWAFARQLQLQPNAGGQRLPVRIAFGAGAGLAGVLGLTGLAWLFQVTGWSSNLPLPGTPADLGPYLLVTMLFSEPLLEELAFRAWFIPLAERAIGTTSAAVASIALFASLHLPFGVGEFASAVVVGGVLAVTYVHTRSLLACVVANALMAGALLVLDW